MNSFNSNVNTGTLVAINTNNNDINIAADFVRAADCIQKLDLLAGSGNVVISKSLGTDTTAPLSDVEITGNNITVTGTGGIYGDNITVTVQNLYEQQEGSTVKSVSSKYFTQKSSAPSGQESKAVIAGNVTSSLTTFESEVFV